MYTIIIRTTIMFFVVIFTMRLMGKRQIGELQPFELVVTMIISELAAFPVADPKIPMLYGIIPIVTLILLEVILAFIQMKFEKARILFSSHPSLLIRNGKVDIKEMKKQKFNIDDLLEELRLQGYFNLDEIEYAILETSGKISVIPKTELTPITKEDMKIKASQDSLPLTLVVDGKIREHNLHILQKDDKWLMKELKKQGEKDLKNIFIALLDSHGKIYVQLKKDGSKSYPKKDEKP